MHDHRDLMESLARDHGWRRGVELGVGRGLLLSRFLALGIEMVAVDMGVRADRRARQEVIAAENPKLCRMILRTTAEAAALVKDGWADFVFVDAGHSYDAAKEDIRLWRSKVRSGGWFGGHDYHPAHPGVIRAVNEAFGNDVDVLPFAVWTVRA